MKRRRIAWLTAVIVLTVICTSIEIYSPVIPKSNHVSGSISSHKEVPRNASAINDNLSSYSINKSGQTYGSASNAASTKDRPDLIAAIGTNGISGYIYNSDLMEGAPTTPAEAIAQQEAYDELAANWDGVNPIVVRTIPLYDVEGKSVIGEYDISFTPNRRNSFNQASHY